MTYHVARLIDFVDKEERGRKCQYFSFTNLILANINVATFKLIFLHRGLHPMAKCVCVGQSGIGNALSVDLLLWSDIRFIK